MISIVYDNHEHDERLGTAWGFACVIEGLQATLLFDAGGDGELLLANMESAGFAPEQIDRVVLSHIHADHTGGLEQFLLANPQVTVFLPSVFPAEFKDSVRRSCALVVETSAPCPVCEGAWTTGVLGDEKKEQGLSVRAPGGQVLVTGCAHPGIVRMVDAAKQHTRSRVDAILGGFHMRDDPPEAIGSAIGRLQEAGVRQCVSCHCSGDEARSRMQRAFGRCWLPSGVGARFAFADAPPMPLEPVPLQGVAAHGAMLP